MDEEQVKALIEAAIAPALEGVKTELTAQMHTANQGVASTLSKAIAGLNKKVEATPPNPPPAPAEKPKSKDDGSDSDAPIQAVSLEMQAMKTQLEKLNADLVAERAAKERAAAASAIAGAVTDSGAQAPTALRTLIEARYAASLKEENGSWYVSDGVNATPLLDTVKAYLATDEGKHFVPSSGVRGSGAREVKPVGTEGAIAEKKADLAGIMGDLQSGNAVVDFG